jgi:protein-tyrosine-phosphatase
MLAEHALGRSEGQAVATRVLFVCTGNSARSQMAEGLLRQVGKDRFEVFSAGSVPREHVHPLAVATAAEHGIDLKGQVPKDLTQFAGREFDYVITLCDRAKEACPTLPGAEAIHWSFDDPTKAGVETDQARAFKETFRGLKRRIDLFMLVAERK